MSIRTSEEKLFADWRVNRHGFVSDGVVDEDAYLTSCPKLLFVMKEVNDPDGGDWDLREFVRDGGRWQTWDNISRWVEGIRSLSEDIPWEKLEEVDAERRRRTLRSIAVMNLKKSPGGHTTDSGELAKVAEEDQEFLNKQFALYDADVTICCGTDTSNTFHGLISLGGQPQWKSTRRGTYFHEYRRRKFVVAYSHPEARVASPLLYYGLVDAMREVLSTQQFHIPSSSFGGCSALELT
jgi:hypothetical protein